MAKDKKIKFVMSPSCAPFNLGYNVGDVVKFEEKQANELIEQGFALPVGSDGEVQKVKAADVDSFKAELAAEKAKSADLQAKLDAVTAELTALKTPVAEPEKATDKGAEKADKR